MNRNERRSAAARKRRWKDKTVVMVQCFRSSDGLLYWFEEPEGWAREDGIPDVEIHGPFKTEAEAAESQRLVLMGPQCKVTEGDMWDQAWDRMQ
jgi:hypothetical protein